MDNFTDSCQEYQPFLDRLRLDPRAREAVEITIEMAYAKGYYTGRKDERWEARLREVTDIDLDDLLNEG